MMCVWKKLKLAGMSKDTRAALESDKENAPKSTLRDCEYNAMRDLDKYMKIVGTVIPGHPSYRRRKDDADIKELEVRPRGGRARSLLPTTEFEPPMLRQLGHCL